MVADVREAQGRARSLDWRGKGEMWVRQRRGRYYEKKESRGQKSGEGTSSNFYRWTPVGTRIPLSPNPRASFGPAVDIISIPHLGHATMTHEARVQLKIN